MSNAENNKPVDVRGLGFTRRASAADAWQWLDQLAFAAPADNLPLGAALGRLLAEDFTAPEDAPAADIAADDGYAVRAAETLGAGSYNPLLLRLVSGQAELEPMAAQPIHSGEPLPTGSDAIADYSIARPEGPVLNLIGSVACGAGVVRRAQEAQKGSLLLKSHRPLRPASLALLASFGVDQVRVLRRPLVRILTGHSKLTPQRDALGLMLRALVVRDGGAIETFRSGVHGEAALRPELLRSGADLILACGGSGTGSDDDAALLLASCGELARHGLAVRPGGSTALGLSAKVPVILLPGNPLDCLCAYDLFAARLLRRISGLAPALPYRKRHVRLARKLVSEIGTLELCRVRLRDGEAVPLGTAEAGGLCSAAQADGFIVVPETLEGYAPGADVEVHLYDELQDEEGGGA